MPRRRGRAARAQIRSAQLARTGDGPGGGSRRGTCSRRSTTGPALVEVPSTATRIGADPIGTTRSTFCAGTEGTAILSQDCRAPPVKVLEAGAGASLGQQHEMRIVDPQRTSSNPWLAPDASSAGARRAARSLLWKRARITVGYAEPMPLLSKKSAIRRQAGTAQTLHFTGRGGAKRARQQLSPNAADLVHSGVQRGGSPGGWRRGRRITKVVVPSAERASSVPPCESTICCAM